MSQEFSPASASPSQHGPAREEDARARPTIVELFASQVATRPFSVALEINERTVTYRALSQEADRLARLLSARGIGREDVVAICLKRSEHLLIAMLGVLQAGAAYLPLSPTDPPLRLAQVIAHAGPRCVVTDTRSDANLPTGAVQIFRLDDQHSFGKEDRTEIAQNQAPRRPAAQDLAYVIYTSGTTGTPKGVAVTHGGLANVITDVAQRVHFAAGKSWLAVTTATFDIAALELLLPLGYGGKVILATEDQARIGRLLLGILRQKEPAVMQATPITWRILIESGWEGSPGMTVLCGGDRLDRELANTLVTRCAALWNMYGPTETTIWSTADLLTHGDGPVTIGRPILDTEVYILDGETVVQPVGEVGEICIGGAGVARGYVNDPHLTQQRFIDLKVEGAAPRRVYRTGDLGRWNEAGNIEFYGRIDQQVKINGFRIELPEIEQVIRGYAGVADVAVLGVGGATNQKRLYAFVVGEPEAVLTRAGLVAHVERHLPHYMVPERFWTLPGIPATANGKRDAAALEAYGRVTTELLD